MSIGRADLVFARRTLTLAKKAWGETSPNPMVGATLVRDGRIVGEGFHERAGGPHAEVVALRAAGESARGATLYVNLEPCSTTGRTPPCVDAIVAAGVRRVVIGCLDPNPAHAGRGADILRQAGLEVTVDVEKARCEELNEAFFHWITRKTPFVLLKMAMTLDGKIATVSGNSQWVTGPTARARVQKLRRWADAVMVGGETVRSDRPSLTVRGVRGWRQPLRLVASRTLSPETAAELMGPGPAPEIVRADSPEEWRAILNALGSRGVTGLLVEGGGKLAASLLRAGVVNKVEFHVAPKILGGEHSRPVVGGPDPLSLEDARDLERVRVFRVGNDMVFSGYPVNASSQGSNATTA